MRRQIEHLISKLIAFSTSTLFHSEAGSLALPLRDAFTTILEDFRIVWTPGDPIRGVQAAHLYYNLYVAMLDLWRDVDNRPIPTTIDTSTPLYPNLAIRVVPNIYLVPSRRLTPNMAAVVLYKLVEKCLTNEPTFWIATLVTRDASSIAVAGFHTKHRLGAIPIASGGLSNTTSLRSANFSDDSDTPGNSSNIVSSSRITVHVGFQGPLPELNARTRWLSYFLAWSFSLLSNKASTNDVVTMAEGVIQSIWFKPRADLRVAFESHGVTAPPGASKLTCELPILS